ncbi:MAG TPA: HD domain-containing phosphohydrolase [Limnobacter sp.]|nr:HD domain-containing phosphohydrolase [Limnobacter sp.]
MNATAQQDDVQSAALIHGFTGQLNPNKPAKHKILFVDDDSNIINALRRVFRLEPYDMLFTTDPREAISLAKREKPAVVICDMRMPGLSGVDVLQAINEISANSGKIILTGHADVDSSIDAINLGQVDRFLSKPWKDDEIRHAVSELVELFQIRIETEQLNQALAEKVYELENFRTELQSKVDERLNEIRQVNALLDQSRKDIKLQYLSAIRVFCNFLDLRSPALAAHSRRVAELSRILAQQLALDEVETQQIYIAALLHDIGKIGLPDRTLFTPFASLDGEAQSSLLKHPVRAQTVFLNLPDMSDVSTLIRHHHERYDGQGFPDGLAGANIPLGSRILAVAEDYDELQQGWLAVQKLGAKDAQRFIVGASGRRYDPEVIHALPKALEEYASTPAENEQVVSAQGLKIGAILARDFIGPDGYQWGSKDQIVNGRMLSKFRDGERVIGHPMKIYVFKPNALKMR